MRDRPPMSGCPGLASSALAAAASSASSERSATLSRQRAQSRGAHAETCTRWRGGPFADPRAIAFPAHQAAGAQRAATRWMQADRLRRFRCPNAHRDPPSGGISAVGAHAATLDRHTCQLPIAGRESRRLCVHCSCRIAVARRLQRSSPARACERSALRGRTPKGHSALPQAVPGTESPSSRRCPGSGERWRPIQTLLLTSMSPTSPSPRRSPSASAGTGLGDWPTHEVLEPSRVRSRGTRPDRRVQPPHPGGCR